MSVILVNAEAGRIPLPDGVVHCSVSSPPYYSLRAYQGDQARDWPEVQYSPMPGLRYEWIIDEDGEPELCGIPDGTGEYQITIPPMRCALGHEPTPEAFIGHLVACYREVYRVLRDDGVCWIVIGDSSAGSWGNYSPGGIKGEQRPQTEMGKRWDRPAYGDTTWRPPASYMPQGNRILIPHRLALALQADGWTVRNDNVWAKTNPMPESVQGTHWQRCRVKVAPGRPPARQNHLPTDGQRESGLRGNAYSDVQNQPNTKWQDCPGCPRCEATGGYVLRRGSWRHTRAHETVLHLTKGMGYWSDGEAVREPHSREWFEETRGPKYMTPEQGRNDGGKPEGKGTPAGRNPRSVLTPAGEGGYPGAHYATFLANLIRPLIKSSCPARCCPACGSGWAPIIEKPDMSERPTRSDNAKYPTNGANYSDDGGGTLKSAGQQYQEWRNANPDRVIDYRPTCECRVSTDSIKAEFGVSNIPDEVVPKSVPGLVLDPFLGSGTSLLVTRELGLNGIGLDLSYDYLRDQARARLGLDAWDAWHGGGNGRGAGDLTGLPLFEGMT